MLLVNALGHVTYVSPSINALLGFTTEELLGRPASLLIHPDDLATLHQVSVGRGKTPGRSLNAEYRLRTKHGTWHWFEGRGTNLLQVPEIAAIVGSFRDITLHKLVARPHWSEMGAADHFVQFYEDDGFLLDSASGFINAGLAAGDGCLVLASPAHRAGFEERLHVPTADPLPGQPPGDSLLLDAGEVLTQFLVDGLPEPARFAQVVGGLIARVAEGRRHVRIFGEMVALLWAEHNEAAALRLEELWNDLRNAAPLFSLFCAYAMQDFAGEAYRVPFTQVCQQHARVIPTESYTALTSPDERLRAITLLQQQAHSLQATLAGKGGLTDQEAP
jgi:PAS domain S-box-containing protein